MERWWDKSNEILGRWKANFFEVAHAYAPAAWNDTLRIHFHLVVPRLSSVFSQPHTFGVS